MCFSFQKTVGLVPALAVKLAPYGGEGTERQVEQLNMRKDYLVVKMSIVKSHLFLIWTLHSYFNVRGRISSRDITKRCLTTN